MRLITLVVKDENGTDLVISMSLTKGSIRNIEGLKTSVKNAIRDYQRNTKIKNKKNEFTWKDIVVIPSYITEPNGFKVLRIYSGKDVFFGNIADDL